MKRFVPSRWLTLTSLASVVLVAACSISGGDSDSPAGSNPVAAGGEIRLDTPVKFEGEAKSSADAPKPYTHQAVTEYTLVLDEDAKVGLQESMSATGCLEGEKAEGAFVTLYATADERVTTDTVAYPSLAVTGFDFSKELKKGRYKVQVVFYATSESCGSNLEFSFTKQISSSDDGIDDSGNDDGDDDGGDDGTLTTFDTNLVGTWTMLKDEMGFAVKLAVVFAADGTATQRLTIDGTTYLDEDVKVTTDETVTPSRLDMTVTAVRVNDTDNPAVVGDVSRCVYEKLGSGEARSIRMACSDIGTAAYPIDFSEAETFVFGNGTVTPPPPPPPPVGGTVVKELTGIGLTIPDNYAAGITKDIVVSENVRLTSVSIALSITHSYVSDMRISLIAPDRTEVVLHDHTGSAPNLNVTYGAGGILVADLSRFAGKSTLGTWKLKIVDDVGSDIGVLNSIKLSLAY